MRGARKILEKIENLNGIPNAHSRWLRLHLDMSLVSFMASITISMMLKWINIKDLGY